MSPVFLIFSIGGETKSTRHINPMASKYSTFLDESFWKIP